MLVVSYKQTRNDSRNAIHHLMNCSHYYFIFLEEGYSQKCIFFWYTIQFYTDIFVIFTFPRRSFSCKFKAITKHNNLLSIDTFSKPTTPRLSQKPAKTCKSFWPETICEFELAAKPPRREGGYPSDIPVTDSRRNEGLGELPALPPGNSSTVSVFIC